MDQETHNVLHVIPKVLQVIQGKDQGCGKQTS